MDIDDLTLGDIRQLTGMFGRTSAEQYPCVGKKVLVILPGRFIYMGTLEQIGCHYVLKDAQNIRYWAERNNGLGGLAKDGPNDSDKVDDCPPVWFRVSEEIAIMECEYV